MFLFMAAVGLVAFAFCVMVMFLILVDRDAREVINQLPIKQGQASNVDVHDLRFPTGDNQ